MPVLAESQLRNITAELLLGAGAPLEEAHLVARLLVAANLAGHDSHGVLRLPAYLQAIREGLCRPGTPVRIVCERPAMAILDGGWNFGQVVAARAAEMAIAKARSHAVGVVTAHRACHVGRLADYCAMAAASGCIGIMSTNGHGSDQDVSPHGGTDRRLPTNPIGYGLPTGKGFPLVLDMTTSVVATGKLRVALHRGESIPPGWILDGHGRPSTDPKDFWGPPPGCSLPLGGYKGFGLGLVLDILSGALSEAGCTRGESCPVGNGIFFQAIHIESFTTLDEFLFQVDRLIDHVKGSPLAPGFEAILMPGEASARRTRERQAQGIPVDEVTWQKLAGEFAGAPALANSSAMGKPSRGIFEAR
ncbi:MAG: Ldh family oxidoreductase [Planctomycetes bacterium]|nr:Ldh family oxidoreductase [Planctomycetota bacterium]